MQERPERHGRPLAFKLAVPVCRNDLSFLDVVRFNSIGNFVPWRISIDRACRDLNYDLVVLVIFVIAAPTINSIKVNCADTISKAGRIDYSTLILCLVGIFVPQILHNKLANSHAIRV